MASETASSMDGQLVLEASVETSTATKTIGKHRILAEMKRLEQELRFLEEELEELDKTENVSTICRELLPDILTRPDPLLPEINCPINPAWDRWFEGPSDSPECWCCIL